MNKLLAILAWGSLLWLCAAAILCFTGRLEVAAAQTHFLATTIAWFVAAPLADRRR